MLPRNDAMLAALRSVAPGTPLRDGVDRVLQARMGALIVVGDTPDVLALCSGGFDLDAEYSPQKISELAKMDGAIILSTDARKIVRANVQMMPDASLPTIETGTRHRSAERTAHQVSCPVIAVSEELMTVTVYRGDTRKTLEPPQRVMARADQVLQILARYRERFDSVLAHLTTLEFDNLVTTRDIATVLQRAEMVLRTAHEIEEYVIELGSEGRLPLVQLDELTSGVAREQLLVAREYSTSEIPVEEIATSLHSLPTDELLALSSIARVCGLDGDDLEAPIPCRGIRILSRVPRLSEDAMHDLFTNFGSLSKLIHATTQELSAAGRLDESEAQSVHETLSRMAEASS